MAERKRVVVDAGHGGSDPGAQYNGRQEKTDNLRLALAVGQILSDKGVDVFYTRVNDTYDTPFEKAMMANTTGADYLVSIHRNAMLKSNTASGIMSLVYQDSGVAPILADNINDELEKTGFKNLGVLERPGLVILRRTQMPAVLVEAGFIDNDADNQFFDRNFDAIANAIANGVLETIKQEENEPVEYYQVQVGVYQMQGLANQLLTQLQSQGFPAFIVFENGYYMVRVGAFMNLDHAVEMEKKLRSYGYNTVIVKEAAKY